MKKSWFFVFTLALCAQTTTFAQWQTLTPAQADSAKAANTIKKKMYFDGDPWAYLPQSLKALEDLHQVSFEVPLAPNRLNSGLWWVFDMQSMTLQVIPAKNPTGKTPTARHAHDTVFMKMEPEFPHSIICDTSANNIVRELRMKFWVEDGVVKGNWAIIYQADYGNENAIAQEMAQGHLQLRVPAADRLNADYPIVMGYQWQGASAAMPEKVRRGNYNLQILLWR